MQFSGGISTTTLARRDLKRRLTSPQSPQLQKLPGKGQDSNVQRCSRLKDSREGFFARECKQQVHLELQNQQQQCRERFQGRWHYLRNFYAIVSEMMSPSEVKGKLPPTSLQKSSATAKTSIESQIIAPLHTLTAMSWLIDVAREFRHCCASYQVTLPQMEILIGKALHLTFSIGRNSTPTTQIASCLRKVFQAFQRHPEALTIDYRTLLSALFVLDRWREGEKKMVARWFQEFAFPLAENSTAIGDIKMAVREVDLEIMLFSACGDEMDEAKMLPYVTELLATMTQRKRGFIVESRFWSYSDSHPKLLEMVRLQCWKRLTDDTRLTFYRDVYLHAKERFAKEEVRVRMEKAVGLWRTREPRLRFVRWKMFVANCKLFRQGDTYFELCSARKMVTRFKQQHRRRQEMRKLLQIAQKHRKFYLSRFIFQPWVLFWRSMHLLHQAARKRSGRHYLQSRRKYCWKAWIIFYEQAKARNLYCENVLATFLTARQRKILQSSMDNWVTYKRRQDEVAAADSRGRQLQEDLLELQQMEVDQFYMESEDALSAAMEAKARAIADMGRRRSYLEATDRVYMNRKMQKQNKERIQYKANQKRIAELEAKETWTTMAEQVATEVRTGTLIWLDTPDAKEQIYTEARRIFEMEATWIRNELLRDPENGSSRVLPQGCRWQVFMEAPHGTVSRKQTKAFYFNSVTYERYWCDEIVLEECDGIAREVIIQWRLDDALSRLKDEQLEMTLQRCQNVAATRIQMMFRCREAQLLCRKIIRNTLIKRIDPSSRQIVYFNLTKPQESQRKPPKLIGSDEFLIPIESSTWVYRQNSYGTGFYERLDTGQSSTGPPDHYILCARCSVYFVTRRKTATGARYCVGCYANLRYAVKRDYDEDFDENGWTKMPMQPANCMVCRNKSADFVCTDCKHDTTCARCYTAIHGKLTRNKTHTAPISLVNRSAE